MYSIQHYVIKFVSDLQQVGGFLWVLRFTQPIRHDITKILLNVTLCTITPNTHVFLLHWTSYEDFHMLESMPLKLSVMFSAYTDKYV